MTVTRPSVRDVVVLHWNAADRSDRRAEQIAAFLGAEVTAVSLSSERSVPKCTCLVVDVETLAKAAEAMPAGSDALRSLTVDAAAHVFVYGGRPTSRHEAVLRALSSGIVTAIRPLSNSGAKFCVAAGQRDWCGQFSGLSLAHIDSTRESRFECAASDRMTTMIAAGAEPFFVRLADDRSQLFFVACDELADLDQKLERQTSLLSWFSRLAPLMMFLRGALGTRVWHNDSPRACFIIDDPSLTERHGFLEYDRLVESMRRLAFSTCIAFIPWNVHRSRRTVAALLSSNDCVPSLCIHGCDHTAGEFAAASFDVMHGKARLALERMRTHERLTSVPFDDVMVFPQGLFSVEALSALKASGYLAAVNSDVFPSAAPATLALRELLDVAVTRFDDFPLFGRRYPRDTAEFAFDLFLGKPALIVEHHGYFRNGYSALESFVGQLNGLDEQLEWASLGAICSHACLTKAADAGAVHVRFYTHCFSLTNTTSHAQHYVLRRRTQSGLLPSVSVNGHEWSAERDGQDLRLELSLAAGKSAHIDVSSNEAAVAESSWKETAIESAKVRLRRAACDFRDNHVDTNPFLNAIVATARNVRRRA
jgi:hypothetical protein